MTDLAVSGDELIVRQATQGDRDALAALHVLVWRDTYGRLAPAVAYEALDEAKRRSGYSVVKLAVVSGNDNAVRFYEREGGSVVGNFVDGVLWRSDNIILEFRV